jgi:hypothetical protein
VEFVAFPIGHAGYTLTRTLDHLTAAFSTVRPPVERSRASMGISSPATDHNAKAHDFTLFKSLLDAITDLAQSRLLGIISNRKRLVDALPRGDSGRAHPIPPLAHHQTVQQQGPPHTLIGRARHAPRRAQPSRRDGGTGKYHKHFPAIAPSYPCPL